MDSPGKNTGVNFHSLLQRIFLTQGLNWHVLHLNWQVGSLPLEPPVSLFLIKCWPLSPVWLCSLLVSCPWNSPGKNTAVDCHSLLQIIFLIEAKWSEVKWKSLSHVWLFATPWTAARQASLSITNSRSSPKLLVWYRQPKQEAVWSRLGITSFDQTGQWEVFSRELMTVQIYFLMTGSIEHFELDTVQTAL